MDLASLSSENQYNFIISNIQQTTVKYWIGLTSRIWEWTSGQQLNYFRWTPGRPSDVSAACLSVYNEAGVSEWEDTDCESSLAFVCQTGEEQLTSICKTINNVLALACKFLEF